MSTNTRHGHYQVLDGMRGMAAIAVMLYHYSQNLDYPLFRNAPAAVDLFFMLSGFVIAHSYGARLRTTLTYAEYSVKRVIRLYPMFIMGIAIGTPVLLILANAGLANAPIRSIAASVFYNSMFMPDFNSFSISSMESTDSAVGEIFPTNPPAWSLFFEMLASLAFPFLFASKRINLFRLTAASFCVLLLLNSLYSFTHHGSVYVLGLGGGWGESNFLIGFPRAMFGFSAGILLHSFVDDRRLDNATRLGMRFIRTPYALYLVLMLLFAFPKSVHGLYPAFLVAVAAPCLVCMGAKLSCDGSMATNISRFLGWISFPIYCLHFPIGRGVFLFAAKEHYTKTFALLASIAITLTLSIIVTKLYEEPVRRYLSRKLPGFALPRPGRQLTIS